MFKTNRVWLLFILMLPACSQRALEQKMEISSARTRVALIDAAVPRYLLDVGNYPSSLEALHTAPADLPRGKWEGPYLKADLLLDPWGKPFKYSAYGTHNLDGFDVWTIAPDGQEIGNWKSSPK